MKSLEIVNERIDYLEGKLKSSYELSNGHPISFNKQLVDAYEKSLDNCKQVKQDLEVLEIIRKKDVNLATLKLCIMRTDTIEQLLSKYNKSRYFTQDELTLEELLKLKQWLEENENG